MRAARLRGLVVDDLFMVVMFLSCLVVQLFSCSVVPQQPCHPCAGLCGGGDLWLRQHVGPDVAHRVVVGPPFQGCAAAAMSSQRGFVRWLGSMAASSRGWADTQNGNRRVSLRRLGGGESFNN